MANREIRRADDNKNAKISDIKAVYNIAVCESNLVASAMITIACNLLIDKGVFVLDEVNAYFSEDNINLQKAILRQAMKEKTKNA